MVLVDPANVRVRRGSPLMTEVGKVLRKCFVVLDEVRNRKVQCRPAFPFRARVVNGPAGLGPLNKEWLSEEIQLTQQDVVSPALRAGVNQRARPIRCGSRASRASHY